MKRITAKNFDNALETSKLVIVNFTAPWCVCCNEMRNVIIEVENKYRESAEFLSVDFDEEKELFNRFQVSFVPTLVAFKNGKIINRQTGFILEAQLCEKVERLLKR